MSSSVPYRDIRAIAKKQPDWVALFWCGLIEMMPIVSKNKKQKYMNCQYRYSNGKLKTISLLIILSALHIGFMIIRGHSACWTFIKQKSPFVFYGVRKQKVKGQPSTSGYGGGYKCRSLVNSTNNQHYERNNHRKNKTRWEHCFLSFDF